MNMKVDLDTLLKQAQDMQSKMQSAQAELAQIVLTGEAGGGMITIEMDGRHTVKSVWLDPASLKEPKEFVEELLVAAFNDALQKIEKASRQKLNDLTSLMQTKFSDNLATTTEE
jgi:hypothetical protein